MRRRYAVLISFALCILKATREEKDRGLRNCGIVYMVGFKWSRESFMLGDLEKPKNQGEQPGGKKRYGEGEFFYIDTQKHESQD